MFGIKTKTKEDDMGKIVPLVRTGILLPDLHIPYSDKKTLAAIEHFMADNRWDWWVCLGDLLDFDEISKFNADLLRNLETKRIKKDYAEANSFLIRHREIVRRNNPEALMAYLEGNHEFRMEAFLDKAPAFEGLLEVSQMLNLSEKQIKWVRSWSRGELYQVGKLYLSHGLYTNKYHANKMVDRFGVNMAYGHTHDIMTFPHEAVGKAKVFAGTSLGCLCEPLDYTRNRPANWQQGFGVVYVLPNGNFYLYPVRVFEHKFIFNGKLYQP